MSAPAMKDRPRCACCDKRLQPAIFSDGWSGRYHGFEDTFCTKSCAQLFASVCYKSGVRIQRAENPPGTLDSKPRPLKSTRLEWKP